ncbi:MAG: TVP38/TMEM64 family protein [Verrucomicrobiota bacterium JB025]|nr:VTT domain-containing protein [Verrucomicrobiota bacterium JB025]
MDVLRKIATDRRFHRMVGIGVLSLAGLVLWAWRSGIDLATLKDAWRGVEAFLRVRPWLLFAGLVLLPAFPVPVSPLFFLVGTVWSERPLVACGICLLGMGLNMAWTYWLAARPGRGLVERLLARMNVRVPELPQNNHVQMILILRLTPGMPFFIQNYVLGFLRVGFLPYVGISMACSGLVACGVVLSGAGVSDGNLVPVMTGAGLIVLGVVVLQVVRKKVLKPRTVAKP